MLHGELWRKPWNIWTLYLWTSQSCSFHSLWMPAISTWIGDCSSLLLRLSMLENFWCVLLAHLNLTFNHLRWIWCDLLLSIQVTLWLYTLLHKKNETFHFGRPFHHYVAQLLRIFCWDNLDTSEFVPAVRFRSSTAFVLAWFVVANNTSGIPKWQHFGKQETKGVDEPAMFSLDFLGPKEL